MIQEHTARKDFMGKSIIPLLLVFSLCSRLSSSAWCETKAEEARRKDRRHTAIMSYGTYSSPMSWDRKTVIMTQDGRIVAEEIYSPGNRCYAYADLAAGRTTVYEIIAEGRIGRSVELWSMPGCDEMLALSNDGERLVTGCRSDDRAVPGSDPDLVVLTLIERGRMIREIRLGELLPDGRMPEVDSLGAWGRYRRLNPKGYYVIETVRFEPILFDIERGEITDAALEKEGDIENWSMHVDVFNWFGFQYPDDCTFKESRNREGYPTGSVKLHREGSGWAVRADLERISNYMTDGGDAASFEEFAIHMAKIMNSADGPTGAVYVDSVISQEEYTNPHGIDIIELVLSVVDVEWTEEEQIEERSTNIMYSALLAPDPRGVRRVLFLRPFYGSEQQVAGDDLLKRIVNTIGYPE